MILNYFWSDLCTRKRQHIALIPTFIFLVRISMCERRLQKVSAPTCFPSFPPTGVQAWEPYRVYLTYQNTSIKANDKGCSISTQFCWTRKVEGTAVCYHVSLLEPRTKEAINNPLLPAPCNWKATRRACYRPGGWQPLTQLETMAQRAGWLGDKPEFPL